ncbi:hypothetical protein [Lysobacter sp.]|uniref:hypothetical protein n=1 Tax=Lysobacter sp. TaxID=72226 RepID=UPI002D397C9C|nr:hypothetical protein [Lysobacter sp.]HZX75817.1 hypothetical protein [Lysobacter sp.]
MGQNLVANHLTQEQWHELDSLIGKAQSVLQPLLVGVTPTTKKVMVKMGDGSEAFCRKALEVMEENLSLMPRGFDLGEMKRDLAERDAIDARVVKLTRLLEQLRNAQMAVGSDVMVSALEGYAVLKAVGRGEGVQELRKLLGRRFERAPASPKDPAKTTPDA